MLLNGGLPGTWLSLLVVLKLHCRDGWVFLSRMVVCDMKSLICNSTTLVLALHAEITGDLASCMYALSVQNIHVLAVCEWSGRVSDVLGQVLVLFVVLFCMDGTYRQAT